MTFLLGLWSFAFVTLIPGLLLVRVFRLDRVFAGLPVAFGLSLVFNHIVVSGLAFAGIYRRPVMLALASAVTLALLLPRWRWPDTGLARLCALVPVAARLLLRLGRRPRIVPAISLLAIVAALADFWDYAAGAITHFGDVFTVWDAIVSWNTWARHWAAGTPPTATYFYPQLLPTTWSVPYVVLGRTDLQLFAASFDRFYIVFTLWVLAEHALRRRRLWLLAALPAAVLCEFAFNGYFMTESLADVPVAFFGVATIAVIVAARRLEETADLVRAAWLAGALALGAASTKQAGMVIALAAPWLFWFYGYAERVRARPEQRRRVARAVAAAGALAVLLPALWYARAYLLILAGANVSEVQTVTWDMFQGRSVLGRMADAAVLITHLVDGQYVYLVFLIAALSLRAQSWRIPAFAIAAGMMLAWSAFFSYDGRNATLALPLAALLAGEGLLAWRVPLVRGLSGLARGGYWLGRELALELRDRLVASAGALALRRGRWAERFVPDRWEVPTSIDRAVRARRRWLLSAAGIALCALAAREAARTVPTERLTARERYLEGTTVGYAAVNDKIAGVLEASGAPSLPIVSGYRWICLLETIRRDHPCRLVWSAQQAADGSASPDDILLITQERWRDELRPVLDARHFAELGTVDGYDLWRRLP
jgi:hypothetical protein